MIEQLWYTWSTIGLGGAAGFQIRAASAGLANTRDMHVRQLDKYLRYELPPGVDHYNADLTNTPRCLAWLNADNQRIIVHKAYVGKDGYGRPGVFFCHLLAGVPETFPANAIIELWGSPFWQTAEPEGHTSTELPQLDEELSIVAQGELTQERILDVVDYLPSLIYAFFSLKESQKIYIAARDEQVATLIFGLTQSLPFLLQQDLTFSTYETDIAASPALIIGTDAATPEELPRAFPQTYRSEAGFAINCWKPPVVLPAGEATDYANLVKDCFRKGDISRFEAILLAAQESQVQDKKAFLDFVRVAVSIEKKSLTRNDVLKVLSDIDLASYYLKQPEMQVYLLQEALKDALWWQSYPATSIKQLKQSYGVSKARLKRLEGALDDFAGYIMRYACRCFERRSTSAYWYQLLQMLDIIAPPERNAEPWRALLEHHSAFLSAHGLQAREYCGWGTRLDLLQRWKHLHADIPLNQIKPWLPFDWIDFHEFLKHGFPESWQCVTLKELLASFSYPNFLGTLIMEHTPVFLQATRELWAQPEKRVTVLRLFQYVVEKTPQYQYLFLTPILQDPALDQRQLEEVLSCARLTDEQAVEVVKKHAAVLFQFIGLRSVQHIFCLYYSNFLYHWRYLDEKDRDIFNTLVSSRLLNAKLIQLLEEFRVITIRDGIQ
uniref:Uncharacterized protein n=1 Tax=Thermosporothrix sp. COM3 TaxID=2490863 RepID=A0A455SGW3_9CHLR|nr:hypothetical protein KTC_17370 [Thermosporothrix sp. COM3]